MHILKILLVFLEVTLNFLALFVSVLVVLEIESSGKEKVYDLAIIKIKQYMPKIEYFWAKFTLNFP